jgi:hypothetical protein
MQPTGTPTVKFRRETTCNTPAAAVFPTKSTGPSTTLIGNESSAITRAAGTIVAHKAINAQHNGLMTSTSHARAERFRFQPTFLGALAPNTHKALGKQSPAASAHVAYGRRLGQSRTGDVNPGRIVVSVTPTRSHYRVRRRIAQAAVTANKIIPIISACGVSVGTTAGAFVSRGGAVSTACSCEGREGVGGSVNVE